MPISNTARAVDPVSLSVADKSDLRLSVACAAAREAGTLARRRFNGRPGTTGINLKGHQDYLSAVDAEVESLVRNRLLESFPEDSFFGEEGGGSFDDNVWVVDPIDGTANFVRGISHFCISIAYVRDGRTQIGIIYDPMHDELFASERGRGATLNGEPIRVSGLGRPGFRSASTLILSAGSWRMGRASVAEGQAPWPWPTWRRAGSTAIASCT
jgi:myo-inositol-1(or 4)-monophosphatase